MYVVATSVFLLFALIFLGFFIGKKGIVRQDACPDLSNLVLKITMPVTVFCSIIAQQGAGNLGSVWQIFVGIAVLHACTGLGSLIVVKALKIPDEEKGVWIFSCMMTNNGFMGLPLALSIFGSQGMFLMALANVISNLLIFSVGIKLLTWKYPNVNTDQLSLRKMFVNNINIAVVLGFIFLVFAIPIPEIIDKLFGYISNMTSGLSMIVVGLSLSRLQFKEVFKDKKMFLLAILRLILIPLITIGILAVLPIRIDPTIKSILILCAALPTASAQSMITEQYRTNTSASARAVFVTTLFSVITVPVMMMIGL